MKSILLFLILQSMYIMFGMSDANQLSIIVLGVAIVIFVSSYVAVLIKERKHKQNLTNAVVKL